ncbi:MAG: PD-(D/E)XK nuclease domain-containing protein [Spirochaetales bacterium]|nr:PD-(D/E)XK nuclease domain-containing protein [Spirochaetales bacterium]
MRFFNTTGPCNPEDHYMLPPEERLVGAQLHRYIRDKLYWVLHAPRQTGKTTFLQSWARQINGDAGRALGAAACYVSVERCQGVCGAERAMPAICSAIREYAGWAGFAVPEIPVTDPNSMLSAVLSQWSALLVPKALIVLFDEADVLEGEALISFLRQLRGGFADRGVGKFPVSIALVGMRDLKDYITAAKGGVPVNPGSPFNVKADSAVLSNFHRADIERLFAQRTGETGQRITEDALDYVYEQSKGQPWIVNSLFQRATMRVLDEESTETVTIGHIGKAREQMILARETHLDALAYRLEDPQIRGVMETLISGATDPLLAEGDAFRICLDLGLVGIEKGTPVVANPMYREVIARHLTFSPQLAIPQPEWKWEREDGGLDMDRLLQEFQKFWRRHSEIWETKMNYTEAFPHLLLMAFLQRVLNGGGAVEREYAAGRGRLDLAVEYHKRHYIIEVKVIHSYDTPQAVKEEGLRQILWYRDRIDSAASAWLVIFDRRPEKPGWDTRLTWSTENGVTVAGC